MNHRDRKILHTLFAHPINTNISLTDVESVFGELGGAKRNPPSPASCMLR